MSRFGLILGALYFLHSSLELSLFETSNVIPSWALESSLTCSKPLTFDFEKLQSLSDAQVLSPLDEDDDSSYLLGLFWEIMHLRCED